MPPHYHDSSIETPPCGGTYRSLSYFRYQNYETSKIRRLKIYENKHKQQFEQFRNDPAKNVSHGDQLTLAISLVDTDFAKFMELHQEWASQPITLANQLEDHHRGLFSMERVLSPLLSERRPHLFLHWWKYKRPLVAGRRTSKKEHILRVARIWTLCNPSFCQWRCREYCSDNLTASWISRWLSREVE